jgi:D-tyrosyl-tRNA(Tyr) deacylase
VLLVSNFTVAADTKRGRRPSFDPAAAPEAGRVLFDQLVQAVRATGVPVATGEFGGDMRVSLVNDGPATFIVNSRGG